MFTIMNGDLALINGFGQVWVFPTLESAEAFLAANPGTTGTPREAKLGEEEHQDDEMKTCEDCNDEFLYWQNHSCKPRYSVFTQSGYRVAWAPSFDTEAEAEAWMSKDHDWDEPMNVEQI